MASCTAPCFEFSIQAMVGGWNVYQDEWGLSHQQLKAEAQESETTVTTHTDAARPRVCGKSPR